MSGGGDSCMAAILLKEAGYQVVGATLSTWLPADLDPAIEEAAEFCHAIGIKHHVIKSRGEFKRQVVDYFTQSYLHGLTPNPCVRCNNTIKWPYLADAAKRHGCQFVATGHYVGVVWLSDRLYIQRGLDARKDQSYFLWNIPYDILVNAIFPLSHYTKAEVLQLAVDYDVLHLTQKRGSSSVCFLQNDDYRQFLSSQIPQNHPALQPGLVIDHRGSHVGQHQGYSNYTLGQRRGLEGTLPADWCVVHIDIQQNILIVGPREMLDICEVMLYDYQITPNEALWRDKEVFIRVRGVDSVPGYAGRVFMEKEGLRVVFDQPVWAVPPGQCVVVYQNNLVIGGGEVADYHI